MSAYLRATAVAFTLLAGCSESTAVGGTQETRSQQMLRGIVVSGPLSARSGASASGVASETALAYVAMYPGTIMQATSVRVSASSGSGGFVSGPMLDGGFDPIGVAAQPSDSLDVEALGADDAVIARVRVPASRAPTVIRSLPARGRTDVPLSQIITIVFSQPLDATTVDSTSIRLMLNGAAVPSTVTVKLGEPWVVELEPLAPLEAHSAYTVLVGDGIRDSGGNPLVQEVNFDFTTGARTIVPVSIVVRTYAGVNQVESDIAIASPSEQVPFAIAGISANADTVIADSPPPATWTSSNPQVATVSSLGLATAIAPGSSEIQACAGSLCAHATLLVNDPAVGATPTAIGDLGGGWSWVMDMSGDQVTGISTRSDGTQGFFLWSKLRGIEDLEPQTSTRSVHAQLLKPNNTVVVVLPSVDAQLVNPNGTVVISATPSSYIWTRETGMQPLPVPDANHAWYVGALSSQGTVVFSSYPGTAVGFWNAATGGRVLASPAPWVIPQRMNDAGQVALASSNGDTFMRRDDVAYVWDSNSGRVMSTLVSRNFVTGNALFIFPTTINSHGDVAGYVNSNEWSESMAFKWSASTGFRYLKLGEQNVTAAAVALNDAGDAAVALTTYTHGDTIRVATARGAVWTAAGDLIMLKSADPLVFPVGINNAGSVAGHTWSDVSASQVHAQVWEVGTLIASRTKDVAARAASTAPVVSPRLSAYSSAKRSSP